jgi:hypothetical protein
MAKGQCLINDIKPLKPSGMKDEFSRKTDILFNSKNSLLG